MKRKLVLLYSMLAISLVIFAMGAFAWFSVSEAAKAEGASIQATTTGILKVRAVTDNILLPSPMEYGDYYTEANFASGGNAYHALDDIAGAQRTNISGNGVTFYRLTSTGGGAYAEGVYGTLNNYVEFKLYFTGFSGNTSDETVKRVYLDSSSSLSGSANIRKAIRVAFIAPDDLTVYGVWAPQASLYAPAERTSLGFVKSGDLFPANTGILDYSDATPTPDTVRLRTGIAGATSTTTPLVSVDLGEAHVASQWMYVRIWIEGTDATSIDANLSQLSDISLVFGMAEFS